MVFPLYLIILMTTGITSAPDESIKSYSVKNIESKEIVINGRGDSPLWKNAIELTDFIYPWENEKPPFTSLKALHNNDWLYFLYKVNDDNINVYVKSNDKSEVVYSDRVEIFFRKDKQLLPYYALELDPHGRVYDYEAEFYRKFNPAWSWPAGQLIVKANKLSDGYTVEIAISKKSLKQLELLKGNTVETGLFRGDCIEITEDNSKIKWISWVRPDSPTPDFHIPSSFGMLKLEK
jgi:Carbohydrate family 9 binding domain-like